MTVSTKFIKELDKLQPDLKAVLLDLLAEIERNREENVTRKEFWEFAKRTEENFQKAAQRTEENFQKAAQRTEENLQKAAQKTEEEFQKVWKAIGELTESQKQTEKAIRDLTVELGGISHTIGYDLEDKSYPALKKLLKEKHGLLVDRLYRKNLVYNKNRFDEINIYGEARKNGEKLYVIGESKAQFGVRDVTKFTKLLERVKAYLGGQIFPLALAYHYHPQAEEKLLEKAILYFWSYDLIEQ